MRSYLKANILGLLLVFAVNSTLLGDATFFDNLAAFEQAVGPTSFESFEGLNATNILADTDLVVVDDFSVFTPSGPALGVFDMADAGSNSTDGDIFVQWGIGNTLPSTNDELVIDFDQNIRAFSIDITDALDVSISGAFLSYEDNLGNTTVILSGPATNGNEVFFGVYDPDGISSVSIVTSEFHNPGDRLGIDAIRYQVVPEPSCSLIALASVFAFCRRRRS